MWLRFSLVRFFFDPPPATFYVRSFVPLALSFGFGGRGGRSDGEIRGLEGVGERDQGRKRREEKKRHRGRGWRVWAVQIRRIGEGSIADLGISLSRSLPALGKQKAGGLDQEALVYMDKNDKEKADCKENMSCR